MSKYCVHNNLTCQLVDQFIGISKPYEIFHIQYNITYVLNETSNIGCFSF